MLQWSLISGAFMSYIQKSLGEGERLVAKAHFHWWYSLTAWLALIFLGLFLIGIVIFIRMMIHKWTTEIGVTTHRFVKKTGLFTLKTEEMAVPNIEGVEVSQGVWGKLIGYGKLRIEGTGDDYIDTPNIADPIGVRRAIETAKETRGPLAG